MLGKNPRALARARTARPKWPAGASRSATDAAAACRVHNAFGSYMAQVAEVTVAKSARCTSTASCCVVDTGVAVNPDTIVAQMQSGIIFGITAALWGEITLKNGRVEQSNFDNYRMLRINEAPVDRGRGREEQRRPRAASASPAPRRSTPAVLNAVYAATGVRLRKLPIKPALLKTA